MLNPQVNETQVLIISPTRELAEQTSKVVGNIGDFMNVRCHACIGGKSVGEDIKKLGEAERKRAASEGQLAELST